MEMEWKGTNHSGVKKFETHAVNFIMHISHELFENPSNAWISKIFTKKK